METVAPSPADAELNLLTEWGDPNARNRFRRAGVLSVAVHVIGITVLVLLPNEAPRPIEQTVIHHVTPLIDPPLTHLTQNTPNQNKVIKEFNATEMQPRPRIQIPQSLPSTTRPAAQRLAKIPTPPAPRNVPAPALPEPPKVDAAVKELPKTELPQMATAPPPQIQPVEKPKLPLENAPAAPADTVRPGGRLPNPNAAISDALRDAARGSMTGGGLVVGDQSLSGPGGFGGGANLPPSPGVQGSNMQLLSDPMGVDFRPYLMQILAIVRRNWFSVLPESVRLGQQGRVGVKFSIAKNGTVVRVIFSSQSNIRALDQAAVASISMSNPFPPLPREFRGDSVVLLFNFAYNIPKQ